MLLLFDSVYFIVTLLFYAFFSPIHILLFSVVNTVLYFLLHMYIQYYIFCYTRYFFLTQCTLLYMLQICSTLSFLRYTYSTAVLCSTHYIFCYTHCSIFMFVYLILRSVRLSLCGSHQLFGLLPRGGRRVPVPGTLGLTNNILNCSVPVPGTLGCTNYTVLSSIQKL